MSDHIPNTDGTSGDEIDLGQLFASIKRGLFGLFKGFLRIYQFIRKRIVILLILGIVGAAIGYGLTHITSEKLKTDVIVVPTQESKRYFYNIIDEINRNIEAENKIFFDSLDIEIADIKNYEVQVEPLDKKSGKESESELKYLEMLQDFENAEATTDIIRGLLMDQNSSEHQLTFMYKDPESGPEIVKKLLDYINNNRYLQDLVTTYRTNSANRISLNDSIIRQLDMLIEGYTQKISSEQAGPEGQLVLQEEDQIDIHELFKLKNELINQTEEKRIELLRREKPIRIINIGKSQPVELPLFGKTIILIPTILIGLYLVFELIKYLNRKSDELLTD